MKYSECTPYYAVQFIREITEYAENETRALELIQSFLADEMTTTEIEDSMN